MELSFYGAAGTVTGSRFLVRESGRSVLVDCGLFQGLKVLRQRNRKPFPVDPRTIDAVVLTHAHIDHTGYLPALVRDGFRGPVYCTPPTADLVPILLRDSGRIQEEDAKYANRKGFSKHSPATPLYTVEDAEEVFPLLEPVEPDRSFDAAGFSARFTRSGHILGAASVRIEGGAAAVLFSGDVGRDDALLIDEPRAPEPADYVVMESTYGGRNHPASDPFTALAEIAHGTLSRGGVLMIPAFAVGRAQAILYTLHRLMAEGRVPEVPVYLNSPMAIDVTDLYLKHPTYHRLTAEEAQALRDSARYVRSVSDSKQLNRSDGPMAIVAGAGMLSGGRILHHLKAFGGDPGNTIVLVGYQAEGTRGAALLRGDETLKIHGGHWPIRAQVERLSMYSAHGDESDLIEWLEGVNGRPKKVFLVHGEPRAADAMRTAVVERTGFDADVADYLETVTLD